MEKASLRASLSLHATKDDPARRDSSLYQHDMSVFGFRRALCTGERKELKVIVRMDRERKQEKAFSV